MGYFNYIQNRIYRYMNENTNAAKLINDYHYAMME